MWILFRRKLGLACDFRFFLERLQMVTVRWNGNDGIELMGCSGYSAFINIASI